MKDEINKNEDKQKSAIWNIDSILSNIFAYTNRKDLIKFNTVCKKWNNLTNPIIHNSVKLTRRRHTVNFFRNRAKKDDTLIYAEVAECISNNAKHAPLIKKLNFNYKLKSRRAIEVFETFRFISNLNIENCNMSQDQFLGMISPLTQLQELTLREFGIKRVIDERDYKQAVQLPLCLKILRLEHIILDNNSELFVQTINSHSNLVEFSSCFYPNIVYLEPFCKQYPSLLKFELKSDNIQTPHLLFRIFEFNSQLTSLKLTFKHWNIELLSHISSYLIDLEELKLSKTDYHIDQVDFAKFSQPTKIKKLNLNWGSLSNCSLGSILINCPHLEEFDLNRFFKYIQPNPVKFLNLSNPAKLKKLAINCEYLSEGVFDSILLSYPNLNELNIVLPWGWREAIKSIYENCANLEVLGICPSDQMNDTLLDTFNREFYESEFFTSSPKCKSTLKNLTLYRLKAFDSKSQYFNNFENLKSIKFPVCSYEPIFMLSKKTKIDMNLWPGYKLVSKYTGFKYSYHIELKKMLN